MIYEIKHFLGALSDWEDRGRLGAFKFGANINVHKDTDSLTGNQALIDEGLHTGASPSLSPSPSASVSVSASASQSPSPSATPSQSNSPSQSPSASVSPSASTSMSSSVSASPSPSAGTTSVFRDLILFFVKASDGYTYGFGDLGYIYRRDSSGFWQYVYKDAGGRINGAAEWYSQDDHGTYLFWSTAAGNLNRKEILRGDNNWNDVNKRGSVQGDTWPKTNLDKTATWHTMREVGGSLIIANGNFLALVGYDTSYTNEAVDLIPGNIANTIVERKGRTITGTAPSYNLAKGVNAAIDAEHPLAQVGNDGSLFIADMSSTVPFKKFPGGGKVNPGGVTNEVDQANFFEWEQDALSWIDKQSIGNMALFAVFGATAGKNGIYSVGRTDSNKPFVMNLEYALEADELGALVVVNGVALVSYRTGSTIGVKAVDPNNKATFIYEGLDFASPMRETEVITQYKKIEVFMSPLPTGCELQFWYRMNKNGAFVQGKCTNGNATYTIPTGHKASFIISAEGEIYEPRLVGVASGNFSPEIHRIRTYGL